MFTKKFVIKALFIIPLLIFFIFPISALALEETEKETIKSVVELLSSDYYDGRPVGSEKNAEAREYLIEELKQRGLEPGGTSGFIQPWEYKAQYKFGGREGANVIGILYPNRIKTDKKPTVLLSAHYDGALHYEESKKNYWDCFVIESTGEWSETCNAAVDNLTGVAAILAILDIVAEEITTPIAVAFWDGEEDTQTLNSIPGGALVANRGLLGSCYFATYPSIEGINESLQLHINFESVGFDIFNGLENHQIIVGTESGAPRTGGNSLEVDVFDALNSADSSMKLHFLDKAVSLKNNDMYPFIRANKEKSMPEWHVPFVLFTNGGVGTYHSSADDYNHVNWDNVFTITEASAELTKKVANHTSYIFKDENIWINDIFGDKACLPLQQSLGDLADFIEMTLPYLDEKDKSRILKKNIYGRNVLERIQRYQRMSAFWYQFADPLNVLLLYANMTEIFTLSGEQTRYLLTHPGLTIKSPQTIHKEIPYNYLEITANKAFSYTPDVYHSEKDITTLSFYFSITGKPSWATFDPARGTLSGTPTYDDIGENENIVITVTDGISETSTETFSIIITGP